MERHEPESTADLAAQLEALRTSLREERAKSAHLGGELADAREQQTATSEILRVISQSQTDTQPVFDAIVGAAVRLLHGDGGALTRVLGNEIHMASFTSGDPHADELLRRAFPIPLDAPSVHAIALRSRAPFISADIDTDHRLAEETRRRLRTRGWHSGATVLLMLQGEPVGTLSVTRRQRGGFNDDDVALLRTFADQAVIAIENVRLFRELQGSNVNLTHALEQQTATSEVLRTIAQAQTDAQPVFDTIVRSAARLCHASNAAVFLTSGQMLYHPANYGSSPEALAAARALFPRRLDLDSVPGLAILTRSVVHVPDIEEPSAVALVRGAGRLLGFRSTVAVPMMREGEAIGSINVARPEPGQFSEIEVALLQTFADQAVIAIENVRLFNETKEALEQQTATSEILRVIASSPTDIQPVLDAVAESAARLCAAPDVSIFLREPEHLRVAARHGSIPSDTALRLNRESGVGWAVLTGQTVHVEDMQDDHARFPVSFQNAQRLGFRTALTVPLMREDVAIGAINLRRTEALAFTERQVALLETFADQAVLAIENVRLFTELEARNRDLTEALDQQTATAEILGVISQSPTDVQPVFDSIVHNAVRLCGAVHGSVYRFDGKLVHCVSSDGYTPEQLQQWRATWPKPVTAASVVCQAIRTRNPVRIRDFETAPERFDLAPETLANLRMRGSRSVMAVPMLRQNEVIGGISLAHRGVDAFSNTHVELLKTFADQAVIAIENVRLFTELQASNRELTKALDQQTATSDILRAISASPIDVQPVFEAIARNSVRLCNGVMGAVFRFDGEFMHVGALHGFSADGEEATRRTFPTRPERRMLAGRAMLSRAIVHVPDVLADPEFDYRALAGTADWRSLLVVPMLRGGEVLGTVGVARAQIGPFRDQEIALLETFADQAVIAIENVRLFKELEARTAALTRSVDQLMALGEVGRAVSSTLDLETVLTTIVARAVQLSGMDGGVVFEYDQGAEEFVLRVATETGGGLAEARRSTRIRKGEGVLGRTAHTLEAVQVPDIAQPGAYEGRLRETLVEAGVRAVLAVPMVYEGRLIGSLGVTRNRPGEFSAETIDLLRTFATQSALAIQNARLFREIEQKSRELELASQHKSEFLANMSHELRTPLNAILGFSEVLAQGMFGAVNEKQTEYLRDILESGRHLLSLINDILDLSKIEAGRMELELSEFDLPQAIQNALTLVRERALRRGIGLHHAIDSQVAAIQADERKVKQVLLNLLSNAIKFTPEGGRIEVRAAPRDGLIEISVTDTGIGIAPEDLEAVFEEFRQVGTADKKAEGTGLGLSLAKKFIELHRGRIWVESEPDRGSTFTFTLPVA